MISRQSICLKGNLLKRFSQSFSVFVINNSRQQLSCLANKDTFINKTFQQTRSCFECIQIHSKWYSTGILDGDISELQTSIKEKEILKLREHYPYPRVTLHNYSAKTPQKVFDISFKQSSIAPKGVRKKPAQANSEWSCTYMFIWPEKKKFESKAISKHQAAEKAATQALYWLHSQKRIDKKGDPVYDRRVLQELQSTLNEPLKIEVSHNSIEKVDKIYDHYINRIKPLYEATFEEAKEQELRSTALFNKDSTLDEQDESSQDNVYSEVDDLAEQRVRVHPVFGRVIRTPSKSTLERRNRVLNQRFQEYYENATPLPIDQYSSQITSALKQSRVLIVVGSAGCGKSTRAPAAILRSLGANAAILVSEPRRVAAIGLAERVASELGEDAGESVGYQVRLRAKPPRVPAGAILYCTSGVLLRRLQNNPGLEGCTHVFIDEAHERDVNTDVTLLLLKRAMDLNPVLKVVVMSATLDIDVFTRYFDDCQIVEVPGRTFPVSVTYLDEIEKKFNISLPNTMENSKKEDSKPQINCEEVVEVLRAVDRTQPEGAILVFLPGWAEIKRTQNLLEEIYGESGTHFILPVHSRLSTSDQSRMFSRPPAGVRKIVLSTNIAETSVTVPDVVYVVDTGAQKINTVSNNSGTTSLESWWVSRDGAKQRTGRAGRVQPGHCYRLYTKQKEEEFEPHRTPEILRVPLDQTVLELKSFVPNGRIRDFLSALPEPPSDKAVQWAVDDLTEIGAFSPSERLTRIGLVLSSISLRPRAALSLAHSRAVGNMAAAAGLLPVDGGLWTLRDNAEIREFKRQFSPSSDHSAVNWILRKYEELVEEQGADAAEEWCRARGLRGERLRHLRAITDLHIEQFLSSQIIPNGDELAEFSHIEELTAGVLLAGCDSLLVTKRYVRKKGKLNTATDVFTSSGERAHIGGESVNYGITKQSKQTNILAYYGGYHSAERRALVVHTASLIPAHTALLFCPGAMHCQPLENDENTAVLTLPKHKLSVHIPTRQAETILKTREMLHNTLNYYLLRDTKTMNFDDDAAASKFREALIKAVARIIVEA